VRSTDLSLIISHFTLIYHLDIYQNDLLNKKGGNEK